MKMFSSHNLSIKRKLAIIAILPSTMALLLAGTIIFTYDTLQLRQSMAKEITMLSRLIGANNTSALVFDDQKSASANLAMLTANPHVVCCCIYKENGTVFGSYFRHDMRDKLSPPPMGKANDPTFENGYLAVFKTIEFNNTPVGTVYVRYDLETLHARMKDYIGMTAIILLASALVVLAVSSWFSKIISEPVLGLVETAKRVSIEKDYSVRAPEAGRDELGVLIQWFNEMLGQIQERDRMLVKHQDELLKTRNLESLGTLAGGIAHDFNNLLTAIMGSVALVKKMTPRECKSHTYLNSIEKAGGRAKDLTYQLLTFSKGGAPIKALASIKETIEESALFSLRGSNCRCSIDIHDDLWPVEVDKGQISQVIHNLAINANQAMPDGGEVTIQAENILVDRNADLMLVPGKYIRISVQDNGTGIPKDQITRIFDPYFTTKQHGSGLGLAMCFSIIDKHNGLLTVESEVGEGSTFTIYLPASEKLISQTARKPGVETRGSGRILVMDDEAIVRAVTGEILSGVGYRVDFAPDGETTLDMYATAQKSSDPYDLVIMDLTIPGGMSGSKTIAKLLEMAPDARVIAASGYVNGPIMSDCRSYGFMGVLTKPFTSEELCLAVQAVLPVKE